MSDPQIGGRRLPPVPFSIVPPSVLLPLLLWALTLALRGGAALLPTAGVWEGNGQPASVVQALAMSDGTLLAGSLTGLFTSSNRGDSWSKVDLGPGRVPISSVYSGNDLAFAGGLGSLWERKDGHWIAMPAPGRGEVLQLLVDRGMLYAATEEGLFARSLGRPDEWSRLWPSGEAPSSRVSSLHELPDGLLLGSDGGVVQIDLDGGRPRSLGPAEARVLGLEVTDAWTYAAVAEPKGGLLRAPLGTSEWLRGQVASEFGAAIVADPRNPSRLLAGLGGLADGRRIAGVVESWDEGATWTPILSRLLNSYVPAIVLDPAREQIFAATNGGGVFRYQDPSRGHVLLGTAAQYLDLAEPVLLGLAALAFLLHRRPKPR